MTGTIETARHLRRVVQEMRDASRADVARELSIAITHLEDAEMRLVRADIRQKRQPADGHNAIEKLGDELLAEADTPKEEDPDASN